MQLMKQALYLQATTALKNLPEPEEDVDLFVDDVLSENAKSILVLDSSGRTVLVERALRHLAKKIVSF